MAPGRSPPWKRALGPPSYGGGVRHCPGVAMPSSTPAPATTSIPQNLSVRVRWSADPSEVTRLLKLIKRNPLWHQVCFPQTITNLHQVYTTYIDIFMLFYKDDRAMMKDAERQGLVAKVEGDDGETTWRATAKFSSRVGNPVRAKIYALKKDLEAQARTMVYIRPSFAQSSPLFFIPIVQITSEDGQHPKQHYQDVRQQEREENGFECAIQTVAATTAKKRKARKSKEIKTPAYIDDEA
ncbi:hypothetical protein B9479_008140, partial [Cryptococcus floricola]